MLQIRDINLALLHMKEDNKCCSDGAVSAPFWPPAPARFAFLPFTRPKSSIERGGTGNSSSDPRGLGPGARIQSNPIESYCVRVRTVCGGGGRGCAMTIITRSVDRIDGMRGAPFFQPVETDELATEWCMWMRFVCG
jgi:hypothetical protein